MAPDYDAVGSRWPGQHNWWLGRSASAADQSDVQHLSVGSLNPLVGARETTTSIIDLVLGETFHHEQTPNRVTCLDQFAVRGDDVGSFGHAFNLLRIQRHSFRSELCPLQRVQLTPKAVGSGGGRGPGGVPAGDGDGPVEQWRAVGD
jgi:hypothetical protein